MKRIFLILLALLLMVSAVFSASATETTDTTSDTTYALYEKEEGAYTRLFDNEGLLTYDEAEAISNKLDEISETYSMDIVIVTSADLQGKTATEFADDFYDYNGFGFGDSRDGILLFVSLAERVWATSTCGAGMSVFNDETLYYIEDEFVPYLSDEDFYTAFEVFADQCDLELFISYDEDSFGDNLDNDDSYPNNYYESEYFNGKHSAKVCDFEGLLTEAELDYLNIKLEEISEEYQCDVVIVTAPYTEGRTATEFADDFYDYNKYGYNESRDGILLFVSLKERIWATSTCGKAMEIFTDSDLYDIEDRFVPLLSEDDYFGAFETFAELCEKEISTHGKFVFEFSYLIMGLVVGVIIAFIAVLIMKGQLKSVKFQSAANNYLRSGSLKITERADTFLYSTVSRTARPKDTGGSGGGGSHTSSSGSSHGGHSGSF